MLRRRQIRSFGEIWEQSQNRQISEGVQQSADLLSAKPDLTLTFQTSAMGDLKDWPLNSPEREILFPIIVRTRIHSPEMKQAFDSFRNSAIRSRREVTSYMEGEDYFVRFGPVRS